MWRIRGGTQRSEAGRRLLAEAKLADAKVERKPLIIDLQEEIAPPAVPVRPIRVLFIIDSIWGAGGAEMCLVRLIRYLENNGCECRVLTFHSNEAATPFRERFPCEVMHWQINNLYDFRAMRVSIRLRNLVRELG